MAWLMNSPPLSVSRPVSGNGRRSAIVAPETAISWSGTPGLNRTFFSSPQASSFGSHGPIVAARYLPEGMPASRQTLISAVSVSYP